MCKIDLSDRALGVMISKTESATGGKWKISAITGNVVAKTREGDILVAEVDRAEDAIHIQACDPETVRAMCCAIGRMRWDLGAHKTTIAELEDKLARLEKEADWLAERAGATDCLMNDTVENCTKNGFPCVACFREAARKAVGGEVR